jgi:hypothetical protein
VRDGPLEGNVYALDAGDYDEISFKMNDGSVVIYRTDCYGGLNFVGIDPFG